MIDRERGVEAVDRIARARESLYGFRSPFHLAACGGCGGPAFQQPCSLCGFYPMGPDKGRPRPELGTRERFCESVERSGPDGVGGNLATWYAVSDRKTVAYSNGGGFRALADAWHGKAAAMQGLPLPGDVWDLVKASETGLYRPTAPEEVNVLWAALSETSQVLSDERQPYGPRVHAAHTDVKRRCTDAIHGEDPEEIRAAAIDLTGLISEMLHVTPNNGNLKVSKIFLSSVAEAQPKPFG